MKLTRRTALRSAGASLPAAMLAGCLGDLGGSSSPSGNGNGDGNGNGNGQGNGDGNESGNGQGNGDGNESGNGNGNGEGNGDVDDLPIDGRLYNADSEAHTFEIETRDPEDDSVLASDQTEVRAGWTVEVPALGKPEEPRTFEVTVNGETATETFDFESDSQENPVNGHVSISYTAGSGITMGFDPSASARLPGNFPSIDTPPYEITGSACDDDTRELWLCENMVMGGPTMDFQQEETPSLILGDEGLGSVPENGMSEFYTAVLTTEDDTSRLADSVAENVQTFIEETDFKSEAVLVVETGWGSGAVTPHIKGITEVDDGVHAFGCHRKPCTRTGDVTGRAVVARFDQPDTLDTAYVSLTVDPERRISFASDNGVISVDETE